MSNFEDFMISETVQANSQIRTLLAERDTLQAENTRLREALNEVRDLIEGYVDVTDGDYGQPAPNKAMRAMQIIDGVV